MPLASDWRPAGRRPANALAFDPSCGSRVEPVAADFVAKGVGAAGSHRLDAGLAPFRAHFVGRRMQAVIGHRLLKRRPRQRGGNRHNRQHQQNLHQGQSLTVALHSGSHAPRGNRCCSKDSRGRSHTEGGNECGCNTWLVILTRRLLTPISDVIRRAVDAVRSERPDVELSGLCVARDRRTDRDCPRDPPACRCSDRDRPTWLDSGRSCGDVRNRLQSLRRRRITAAQIASILICTPSHTD